MRITVNNLPIDMAELCREADNCISNNAFTGVVLLCKKIIMHTAVERGAPAGKKFNSYVEYLSTNNFVPVEDRERVDYIKAIINEANHNIMLVSREDGEDIIDFTENLLRFIYELR